MNIYEMIELAKNSECGCCWFSEKGPINISKEGVMTPAFQPERSKREDQNYWEAEEYDGERPYLFKIFPCEEKAKSWVKENLIFGNANHFFWMRCSELYGDIERPAEKIWPA